MKHIRKLLALTLAVVMALSVVLPASAATVTYGDARSITRVAAVDVLSSLGVIGGYANGTFRPNGSITRAEISKILAVMLNGGEDPGDQYADACTFDDCKGHWAAGYIGYCVAQGLVGGRNPQTFDPEGKVSVVESAKMLLCALGYDAKYREYSGANWKSNVWGDAAKAGPGSSGLFEDLSTLKTDTSINREDACQMMLNALQADMVYFPNTQTTSVSSVTITKNNKYEKVPIAMQGIDFDYMGRALDDGNNKTLRNDEEVSEVAQLCEKLFPKLRKGTVGHDQTGAPATNWSYDDETVGTYGDAKAVLTADTATSGKTVRGKLPSDPLTVRFYQNGLLANEYSWEDLKDSYPGWANKTSRDEVISLAKSAPTSTLYGSLPDELGSTTSTRTSGQSASILMQIWRKNTESLRRIPRTGTNAGRLNASTVSAIFSTGVHGEYYYDEDARVLTAVCQPYYPGRIVSVIPEVTNENGDVTRGGYVAVEVRKTPSQWQWNSATKESASVAFQGCQPLDLGNGYTVQSNSNTLVYVGMDLLSDVNPADLVTGRYVAFTLAHDPENSSTTDFVVDRCIVLEELTAPLEDNLTANNAGTLSSVRFSGMSFNFALQRETLYNKQDFKVGSNYTVYFTTFESTNALFYLTEPVGGLSENYAYVRSAGTPTDPMSEHKGAARLLFADGREELVYTATDQWDTTGYIVKFTTNKKGEYTLTPVGTPSNSAPYADPVTVTKGKSVMSFGGASVTANDNTVFAVLTRDASTNEETFHSYTGIKNVPSVTAAKYFAYYVEDGIAKLVFLEDVTLADEKTGIYGIMVKTAKDPLKTFANGSYYQVKAIVSGEVTTLNLTEDEYAALGADEGIKIFKNLNYNSDGLVSSHTPINGTQINTMTAPEKGVVTFNGNTSLSYHDNVLVYVYHAQSDTLEISEPEMLLPIGDPEYVDEYNTYPSFYTLNPDYDYDVLAAIYVCTD